MSSVGRIAPWWRRFKRNGYRVDRCSHCGHRFRWSRDARHATGSRDGRVFHGPCLALEHWRVKADERLWVMETALEMMEVTSKDVRDLAALHYLDLEPDARALAYNRVWRVTYDLDNPFFATEIDAVRA